MAGYVAPPGASGSGAPVNMPPAPSQNGGLPPLPPGPDMSAYINAFNSSYANQQAMLNAGLQQALGAMGARRDAASAAIGATPQLFSNSYSQALGMQNSGAPAPQFQANAAGTAAAGGNPNANLDAALGGINTSFQQTAPFAQQAANVAASMGKNDLYQQNLIGQEDLAQQKSQFDQTMAEQAAQDKYNEQMAQWQQLANQAWTTNPNNPSSIQGQEAVNSARYQDAANTSAPTNPALANSGLTQGQVQAAQQDPLYTRIVNQLQALGSDKKAAAQFSNEQARFLQTNNPAMLTVLKGLYGGVPWDAGTMVQPASANMSIPGALVNSLNAWRPGMIAVQGQNPFSPQVQASYGA